LKIAKVIGNMVSTVNHPDHRGLKLMLVQPVDDRQNPAGPVLVAADAAQAGVGDFVLVLEEGKGARAVVNNKTAPIEALIVGVIDEVSNWKT